MSQEYKHTYADLKVMQAYPLEKKIQITQTRIAEWLYKWGEEAVYISFSGGKDSTVMLDLVRRVCPNIKAVYCDTGLEYPEIKKFIKTFDNVDIIRPVIGFKEVLEKWGYPVISKEIADRVYYAKKGAKWALNDFNGICPEAYKSFRSQYARYKFLLDAPFKIASKCCDIMKKRPMYKYGKETGRNKPFIGTMAYESLLRRKHWMIDGCNSFNGKHPSSKPMSTWTEQDVLEYIRRFEIPYAKEIYGDITEDEKGGLKTTGADRTGCMYCMFGIQREKEPNRFQRIKETHPQIYEYCIKTLGCGEVLDWLKIPY